MIIDLIYIKTELKGEEYDFLKQNVNTMYYPSDTIFKATASTTISVIFQLLLIIFS